MSGALESSSTHNTHFKMEGQRKGLDCTHAKLMLRYVREGTLCQCFPCLTPYIIDIFRMGFIMEHVGAQKNFAILCQDWSLPVGIKRTHQALMGSEPCDR
jgi:hypothetical protein